MLEDIEVGDIVINDLGEETTVTKVYKYGIQKTQLSFKSLITGWLYGSPRKSWSYENNGEFVRDPSDRKASNLVKVIKHV